MNLSGLPPQPKPERVNPDAAYLGAVRQLPCCACGRHAPSEAHHCRDMPDYDERGLYERLPGAAQKSGDRDAIPLCGTCHWEFHNRRLTFHALHGRDYTYIGPTRAAISKMEVDF